MLKRDNGRLLLVVFWTGILMLVLLLLYNLF